MEAAVAIDILKNNYPKTAKMVGGIYKGGFNDYECDLGQAISAAISALEEFNQYKDLERQGKLIKLPYAVGDKVYVKMQSGEYAEGEVRDFTHFLTCGFCIVVTSTKGEFDKQNIPFSEFGKTVFLTKEDAQKALGKIRASSSACRKE